MKDILKKKYITNLVFYIFIILISFTIVSSKQFIDENNYSLKAIYHSDTENEVVSLIKKLPAEISKMIIDEEEVEPCIEYTFPKVGEHTIYVLIDISSATSLYNMFNGIKKLDSIIFTQKFNTENISNFDWMFYSCMSLNSIDMSSFNTKSLTTMARMFYDCQLLTSVDFSNFNTTKLKSIEGLFIRGYSLISVNFGNNFNTKSVTNMRSLFFNCVY